jgi:hypothetical protein
MLSPMEHFLLESQSSALRDGLGVVRKQERRGSIE